MRIFFLLVGCLVEFNLGFAGKSELGVLAQCLTKTSIFTKPSIKSSRYYRLKAYEYLIVRDHKIGWYRVPMRNGKFGYVLAKRIAKLPYKIFPKKTRSHQSDNKSKERSVIADHSLKYIGIPYKFGGEDIKRGIDCSAFVKKLYGKIGIRLPRTAAQQALIGKKIYRLEHLQKGDRLYFWERKRGKIGHTGIYLGNGYFAHASAGRKGVGTDSLRNKKWRKMLVAARR